MNDFFNTYFNISSIMKEKRKYKEQQARIAALPEDYWYVFKKIQEYMFSFVTGAGYDMLEVQYGLIDLFEEGAAEGKTVLEVTGNDVAAFADELLKSTENYREKTRAKLNEDIMKKIG